MAAVETMIRERLPLPSYSRAEVIADTTIHVTGIVLALVCVSVLITLAAVWDGRAPTVVAVSIYGACMVAMFSCSGAYHIASGERLRGVLRRFDHAAIYLKIAGTQTPFAVLGGGPMAPWILGGVWLVAVVGAAAKLLYPDGWEKLSVLFYLGLGWTGIAAVNPLTGTLSIATLVLVLVGGLLYSAGVFFHLSPRLRFHNAIWHLFVMAASFVFYSAVLVEFAHKLSV